MHVTANCNLRSNRVTCTVQTTLLYKIQELLRRSLGVLRFTGYASCQRCAKCSLTCSWRHPPGPMPSRPGLQDLSISRLYRYYSDFPFTGVS